jgi:hypothetical protein
VKEAQNLLLCNVGLPKTARTRSVDNLGPGRLSSIPHGLKVGPLGASDPSRRRGSNGRARVSEKRNCGDAPGRNPSSFLSPSTRRVSGGERGRGRDGDDDTAVSPFAGVRVHHRVSAPPSSGLPRCPMPSRVALAAVADEGRRGSGSGCRRRRAPHLRGSAWRKR